MIYVCNLRELSTHCLDLAPSHLISLVEHDVQPPTPAGLAPEHHLRIVIHDICEPLDGCVLAERHHVESLIAFARDWPGERPLLIHCVAGISRSTAAALIALAVHMPGHEREAALRLRQAAPHANPNGRLIVLADALLGLDGRLIAAREAMGPATTPAQLDGPLFGIPLPTATNAPTPAHRPR
jgi:predicted protein tyrosine phosphatase